MTDVTASASFGVLAARAGAELPLDVYESAAGFYIGTYKYDEKMGCETPFTRESVAYWPTLELAETALRCGRWSQRSGL